MKWPTVDEIVLKALRAALRELLCRCDIPQQMDFNKSFPEGIDEMTEAKLRMSLGIYQVIVKKNWEKQHPGLPKDKNFPPEAGQCHNCGGYGCDICKQRGWLLPSEVEELQAGIRVAEKLVGPLDVTAQIRKCENPDCGAVLSPDHFAVYCSNECALEDA